MATQLPTRLPVRAPETRSAGRPWRVPALVPDSSRARPSQRALVIASLLLCDRKDPPTHRRRP
jgi:hypothetical protein